MSMGKTNRNMAQFRHPDRQHPSLHGQADLSVIDSFRYEKKRNALFLLPGHSLTNPQGVFTFIMV
ncbi:hypothetical protein, partial [Faecalibaculum rodentium]|uniref:hypothetical protein n=1 Tax=Faecalibaculum rodentium TaxID=1702221 RepID=UPI0026258891